MTAVRHLVFLNVRIFNGYLCPEGQDASAR